VRPCRRAVWPVSLDNRRHLRVARETIKQRPRLVQFFLAK
jgi:hypothetical protein